MAGKKGMTHYPPEMKREAVRLFYEEGLTRSQITARLQVRDPEGVKKWLWRYRCEGAASFQRKRRGLGRSPAQQERDLYIAQLEMENDLLKKFHTELRRALLAKRNIG